MNDPFSELENTWNSSKKAIQSSTKSLQDVYAKIQNNKRENFLFYYGTISTLVITLIGVACFFYFVAPVKELLSRMGVSLMLLGLLVRIVIELFSVLRAKKIHLQSNSLEAINHTIAFHKFRKSIHGVVAPIILTFYTIGFYVITPEFLQYLSVESVILYDLSYLVIAVILFVQIRKGVVKEMTLLKEIIELKKEIQA